MTGTQLGRNWDATGTLPSRVRLYRNQALQMKVKNAETSRTIPSCAVPDSGIFSTNSSLAFPMGDNLVLLVTSIINGFRKQICKRKCKLNIMQNKEQTNTIVKPVGPLAHKLVAESPAKLLNFPISWPIIPH